MNKTCRTCGQSKALDGFSKSPTNAGGYATQCKACRMEYQRSYRAANPEKYRESNLQWSRSPKARKWAKEYQGRGFDRFHFSGNRELAIERDGERCVSCGMTRADHKARWGTDITVDHIEGRTSDELSNLQTLCLVCHGRKDNGLSAEAFGPKTCVRCGNEYFKKPTVAKSVWMKSKYCSVLCYHSH